MKFTLMTDDVWSGKKVTFEFDEETLPKILENFELFLKANGYEFDGYLDFVTPESEADFEGDDFSLKSFMEEDPLKDLNFSYSIIHPTNEERN